MKEEKFTTNKSLFLKIIFVMLTFGVIFAYFSSTYMRDMALDNLAEDDAEKTSELAFEVLYTKMQEGWSRDDLNHIIDRLNKLKPGLEIHTYRSTLVENLFGKIDGDEAKKSNPFIQRALKGETLFITTDDNKIRYIRPMLVKQECIKCHVNTKVGDVNGVIDMTFPPNDIKISLDTIVSYFLLFTIISIIATFFIFQFMMNKIFISPISTFVSSIKDVNETQNYAKAITCSAKTYEMHILGKSFNELMFKVNSTLEELRSKNKLLEEHKKAIDKSTIVSKADLNGIITYVNDKFCEISGFSENELIGKSHNIVRSPNMPKEAFATLWETIKDKKTWSGVVENRAKNGDSYFVQATVIPILDEKDEIVEYIGIRQDITDLKQLQFEEMSSSVNLALDVHIHELVEVLPISAVIIDSDSTVIASNTIFNNQFSYLSSDKLRLDSLFIEEDGYVSNNSSILDWKDLSEDFQSECTQKVLVEIYANKVEFFIFIKKLKDDGLYLVLFIESENDDTLIG